MSSAAGRRRRPDDTDIVRAGWRGWTHSGRPVCCSDWLAGTCARWNESMSALRALSGIAARQRVVALGTRAQDIRPTKGIGAPQECRTEPNTRAEESGLQRRSGREPSGPKSDGECDAPERVVGQEKPRAKTESAASITETMAAEPQCSEPRCSGEPGNDDKGGGDTGIIIKPRHGGLCRLTVELSCGPATPVRMTPYCTPGLTESAAQRAARQLQRLVRPRVNHTK